MGGAVRRTCDAHPAPPFRRGRIRDLGNLHLADASVFPSSGASNPTLTIAANAFRVADVVKGRL